LENPSLIGASELSSRSCSGFSALTPLLFALLAEGLAVLDGERLRDAADLQRLVFVFSGLNCSSQFQLPRLAGHCTHSPGKTHTLFPYNASRSFTDCEPKRSVPKFFYRNRNPDKV